MWCNAGMWVGRVNEVVYLRGSQNMQDLVAAFQGQYWLVLISKAGSINNRQWKKWPLGPGTSGQSEAMANLASVVGNPWIIHELMCKRVYRVFTATAWALPSPLTWAKCKRNCGTCTSNYSLEIYTHTNIYLPIGMYPEWPSLSQWEESTSHGP